MITITLDFIDFFVTIVCKSHLRPLLHSNLFEKSADIGKNLAIFYSWDFLALVNGCRRQKGPLIQAENPWMTDVCTKFKEFLQVKICIRYKNHWFIGEMWASSKLNQYVKDIYLQFKREDLRFSPAPLFETRIKYLKNQKNHLPLVFLMAL